MENYMVYEVIGSSNGQLIQKARRKGTIKFVSTSRSDHRLLPQVSNHVRLVYDLDHPNILKFHTWYKTVDHLWIIMELCNGGTLKEVIKKEAPLCEPLIRKCVRNIVEGLHFIHKRRIVFNQLQPCRFLLDGFGNIKLFDFTLAHLETDCLDERLQAIGDENDCDEVDYNQITEYTAPDSLLDKYVTCSSDYWGLGCLVYQMHFGTAPFSVKNKEKFAASILKGDLPLSTASIQRPSVQMLSLIEGLLERSPEYRLNYSTVLQHEFMQPDSVNKRMSTYKPCREEPKIVIDASATANAKGSIDRTIDRSFSSHIYDFEAADTGANFQLYTPSNPAAKVDRQLLGAELLTNPADSGLGDAWAPASRMVQSEYGTSTDQLSPANNKRTTQPRRRNSIRSRLLALVDDIPSLSPANSSSQSLNTASSPCSKAQALVFLHLRAKLARIFAYGNSSPSSSIQPRQYYLTSLLCDAVNSSHRHHKSPLASQNGNSPVDAEDDHTNWRPCHLGDYQRWARSTRRSINQSSMDDSQSELVTGVKQLNDLQLREMSNKQLEHHISTLITGLFNSTQTSGPISVNSVSYHTWLLTFLTVRSHSTPVDQSQSQEEVGDQLIAFPFLPQLLQQTSLMVKSNKSTDSILRSELCKLLCLTLYRLSVGVNYVLEQSSNTPLAWQELTQAIDQTLTILLELLRDGVAGANLRYHCLQALGEALVLGACLIALSVDRVSQGLTLPVPPNQWQSAIRQLVRTLSSSGSQDNNSATGDSKRQYQYNASDSTSLSDWHLRLAAARSLDAFVLAIIGLRLDQPLASSSTAALACVNAVAQPNLVARLWMVGFGRMGSQQQQQSGNKIKQELSLVCVNTLAGLIAIQPTLFTTALVDRVGPTAFTVLLSPPPIDHQGGGVGSQQLGLLTRMLSFTASGLLIPLVASTNQLSPASTTTPLSGGGGPTYQRSRSHGTTSTTTMVKPLSSTRSATTSACKRLLADRALMTSLFTHLDAGSTMLRAKAYLLTASIIDQCPQDSLALACDARLDACLDRDIKASWSLIQDLGLSDSAVDPAEDGGNDEDDAESLRFTYLSICVQHLVNLLVERTIPLICTNILTALLAVRSSSTKHQQQSGKQRGAAVTNVAFNRQRSSSQRANSALASTSGQVSCRLWWPAFNCLILLLSGCTHIRDRLLNLYSFDDVSPVSNSLEVDDEDRVNNGGGGGGDQKFTFKSYQTIQSKFCFLTYLGQLLAHWAPANTENVQQTNSNSNRSMPAMSQIESGLLRVTLTLIESLSQQADLVELRRADFVTSILPGLVRLAVGQNTQPEIRSICVKIIVNIADILLGEVGLESISMASLNQLASSSDQVEGAGIRLRNKSRLHRKLDDRPLSMDVSVLLGGSSSSRNNSPLPRVGQQPLTSRTGSYNMLDARQLQAPNSASSNKRYSMLVPDGKHRKPVRNNIGAAVQPPSSEVLTWLFDLVDKLMIPMADRLLACPNTNTKLAFIRLIVLLLTSVKRLSPETPHPSSPATPHQHISSSPDATLRTSLASRFVTHLSHYQIDSCIVHLLASLLLGCSTASSSHSSSHNRPSTAPRPQRCLHLLASLFQLFALLIANWPDECQARRLIVELHLTELTGMACVQLGDQLFAALDAVEDDDQLSQNALVKSNSSADSFSQTDFHFSSPFTLNLALLTAVETLNTLLAFVSRFVQNVIVSGGCAGPTTDTTGADQCDDASVLAEQLLTASRPPPQLASNIVRLVNRWHPINHQENDPSCCYDLDDPARTSIQSQLSALALTALTNLASLYEGEHLRSALSCPDASEALCNSLLSLVRYDNHPSSCLVRSPNHLTVACLRKRLRLFLRILRRLALTDRESRLLIASHLFDSLHVILYHTESMADVPTTKLLVELIGIVGGREVDAIGRPNSAMSPVIGSTPVTLKPLSSRSPLLRMK